MTDWNVQKFLLADRQWRREHRIEHAKSMLKRAIERTEKQFWRESDRSQRRGVK